MSTYTDQLNRRKENIQVLRFPGNTDDGTTMQRVKFMNPENTYNGKFDGQIFAISGEFSQGKISDTTLHNCSFTDDTGEELYLSDIRQMKADLSACTQTVQEISVEVADLSAAFAEVSSKVSADIPTKVSELENDIGYITENDLPEIPTKVSQLSNDMGFITSEDLPTKVSELENDTGYITNDEVETEQLINKGKTQRLTYNGKMGVRHITQTGEFGPWQDSQLITNVYVDNKIREVRNEIPTKVSQLSNDAGYITENDLPEIPTKVSELENDVPYVTNGRMLDVEDDIDSIQLDLDETIDRVDALRGEVDTLTEDSERMNQLINGMSMSIQDIEHKIPSQASTDNQLADKDFVNSSIATNTANFRGTYESEDDFPLSGNTPNDYLFFDTEEEENRVFKRYKWTGSTWAYEYTLNNSSFTANQWATINSGVTDQQIENLQIIADDGYALARQADEAADEANIGVTGINNKIPSEASTQNKLADKAYVEQKALEVAESEIESQPTLTLSGQYEDGTTFSFNIVIKQ